MRNAWFFGGVLALACTCGCSDAEPEALPGPIARFDVPAEGPVAFEAIPFPHDLHLGPDGTVDLDALPLTSAVWEDILPVLNERRGFCTTCTTHFPVDGAVDRASLGEDAAPDAEASVADPVVMVDVDPASPELGRLLPLRVEYNDEDGVVTVRPVRGIVLAPERTYAVALTSRVRGADGAPLEPAPLFAAVRDGAAGGDPATERARRVVGPALDELARAGVERAAIVSAAVFTTWDPTEHARAIAALIDEHVASSPPVAVLDQTWRAADGSLDTLLGTPASTKPGMDAEPAPGVEGDRAVAHETTAFLLAGRFQAPRIVTGQGTDIGTLRRAADGQLEAGPSEDVTFLLTIPEGAAVSNLPVAVVHWGVTGRRQNSLVFADTLGHIGVAVLGIDAFQHGARAPSAEDTAHDLRGDDGFLGPDGLEEHDSVNVMMHAFGVSGSAEAPAASPRFMLGTMSQFMSDVLATLHFVRAGDLTALAGADPALSGLAFDASRIFYIGESLGTIPGTAALSVDSGIAAAVLGVSPGSVVDIFCESPVYRQSAELLLLPLMGIDGEFDELARRLALHPMLNVYRWAIEPVEPQALASKLFREPMAAGDRPDALWQFGELDESLGTAVPDAFVAALGIPAEGAFDFANVPAGAPPFRENVTTPSGPVTAGAWRFEGAGHGLLGQIQQISTVEPPVVPPFVNRTSPLRFENPTELTHGQIATFFQSRIDSGRAEIRAPQ